MKIKTGLTIDIRRTGEFMSGTFTMNGVRQDVRVIPKDIEFEDLAAWIASHVLPMIASQQHGSIAYKKGKYSA